MTYVIYNALPHMPDSPGEKGYGQGMEVSVSNTTAGGFLDP